MDADDSDKDVPCYVENDEEENSSEEDSEEESDDDDAEEDEGGTDAVSEEEEEDGEETVSDEDDNGGEATSTATGGDVGSIDSDAEETFDKDVPDLSDPDMSCPICLNEFVGQDLGSPENCSHTFCFECILEWSKNINTCPIDRIEFHLIYMKQEINGNVVKKVKVKVKKEVEEYVEEVTLCEVCRLGDREDRLLLCDSCDSGYHCECLDPPLETIPIDEWFCPPCSRVLNQRASNLQASHSRLIARTRASEIVRSRIQQHRTANSGDSGSETTQQPHRVRSPARAPRRKKMTKRKTKRKTTSKSKTKQARTKATAAGKSKVKKGSSKSPTKKKRKTKKRKTVKKKKKSKKSWLASMKLVAPSVKKRIADHLGLCKPPPGQSMPYVKKSGGQHSTFVEKLPSLDIVGCRDRLFDFNESDSDLDNPKPSTSKLRIQAIVSRSPTAVASASGINLLDNILEKQNDLLRNSKNITIGKDGSLNMSEKNSSMKQKCGIKNESKNDASQNKTASSSSSAYVEKEKDILAADSPSANTKGVISEDTPSSDLTLSYAVKTERPHLHSRVRFNDTETFFRIENGDDCEQTGKKLLPKPGGGKHNLPCSSRSMQEKEDILHEKASVSIKKEKDNDLLLNSSVSAKRNTSFGNNSHNSPLSFLNNKQNFNSVVDNSGASTNKLSLPCNTDSSNSAKDVSSSGNSERGQMEMGDTSSPSLFDKAENDRKRHLPFLSNSLQRPFKIPKLAKKADKSLVLETKLPSSERVNNHLDTKVLVKSENVSGKLVPDELQSVNKTECDFKLKNGDQKHASVDHTDLSEEMDVEVDADQCSTPDAAAKSSLQEFKQEKVGDLNNKKSDPNSKSSLHKMPKLSGPDNGQLSGSRHSSKGTDNSVQKVANHARPSGMNSDFTKHDRKTHATSSSSKGRKSNEHKDLLKVSRSELKTMKPSEKSSTVKNTELKAPGKLCTSKMSSSSQQKLKEDIAAEIKKHLKDFYVTDLISKDEYKEIMRRSVPKVFQNCGNSIDSEKIRKLVVSYVHIITGTKPDSS